MLTQNQREAVDHHLRKDNWLLNEDLIVELTDHYIAGLEERTVQGMSFDAALQAIHADFGGRKGLLAMEEAFNANQYQHARRMFRLAMLSYFRMPKLTYTLLIAALIVFLSVENAIWQYAAYAPLYAMGIFFGHLLLLFVYYLIRSGSTRRSQQVKNVAGAVFQGFNLIAWVGIWPQLFISPVMQPRVNPILCVLLVLATVLYEASLVAFFKIQWRNLSKVA